MSELFKKIVIGCLPLLVLGCQKEKPQTSVPWGLLEPSVFDSETKGQVSLTTFNNRVDSSISTTDIIVFDSSQISNIILNVETNCGEHSASYQMPLESQIYVLSLLPPETLLSTKSSNEVLCEINFMAVHPQGSVHTFKISSKLLKRSPDEAKINIKDTIKSVTWFNRRTLDFVFIEFSNLGAAKLFCQSFTALASIKNYVLPLRTLLDRAEYTNAPDALPTEECQIFLFSPYGNVLQISPTITYRKLNPEISLHLHESAKVLPKSSIDEHIVLHSWRAKNLSEQTRYLRWQVGSLKVKVDVITQRDLTKGAGLYQTVKETPDIIVKTMNGSDLQPASQTDNYKFFAIEPDQEIILISRFTPSHKCIYRALGAYYTLTSSSESFLDEVINISDDEHLSIIAPLNSHFSGEHYLFGWSMSSNYEVIPEPQLYRKKESTINYCRN